MKLTISTLILATLVSIASHAQNVSNTVTAEDRTNVQSLLLNTVLSIDTSGFDRAFSERQLDLIKIAIFDDPRAVQFKSVLDATQVPRLQEKVDAAAEKLFSNRVFASSFCYLGQDAASVSWNFGISASASARIAQSCLSFQPSFAKGASKDLLLKSGRKVVFLELEHAPKVESWTSMSGDLHIFHTGEITEFELTRALLHEYYVAFDHFWMFSDLTADQYLEGMRIRFKDNEKAKVYFNAFSVPLLRGSFLMARAFEFEERVLNDLFQLPRRQNKELACWDKVRALSAALYDQQHLFLNASYFFLPGQERLAVSRQGVPANFVDVMLRLEALARPNKSICSILIEPSISMVSTFYTSGPRPRIGSGTEFKKDQMPTSEDLARRLTPETLQQPQTNPRLSLDINVEKLRQQWPTSLGDPAVRTRSNTIYFNSLTGSAK